MIEKSRTSAFSPGLRAENFRRIAGNGFGDQLNAYAHSMAWFRDHIYVGTTRANLCMIKNRNPPTVAFWPTKCPDDTYDLDLRAQIWRYDPQRDDWVRVFVSPMVDGSTGQKVPRYIGYRGMTVFRGASDPDPALYVSGWVAARAGRGPLIMRSTGGVRFKPVIEIGEDSAVNSYRALLPFRGRLYTSPTGKVGGVANVAEAPVILENRDPKSTGWTAVSPPSFGDPDNTTIFELAAFNDHLYAGTLNPTNGFQIWKTRARGRPPYQWRRVINLGAWRGRLNEGAISFCEFRNALYVGTGIQNGGYDRANKVGPAAAELIRLHPDDTWDLIVGEPRRTLDGRKVPLSGRGPGFDNFFNGYIWRLAVHNGWLYAGTYNWSVMLPYLLSEKWPEPVLKMVKKAGSDNLVQDHGGFDLWRSRDGVNWIPVTTNGFNNPYNFGARTIVSTPTGLFVGTANPFGPDVAVKTATNWTYTPNAHGGLEVWLGMDEPQTIRTREAIELGRPAMPEDPSDLMVDVYDRRMYESLTLEYYGNTHFHNFGFWREITRTQKQACENLMEELLSFIPRKKGRILDVACGKGATTKYLLKYYTPSKIIGTNISEKQLETCRENVPGITFLAMDAATLEFDDNYFDNLICVESVFHFDTRERFLQEAQRVLKPGGRLVLSDILMARRWNRFGVTKNYVSDLNEYRDLYLRAGFEPPQIVDATKPCWEQFCMHLLTFLNEKLVAREIEWQTFSRIRTTLTLSIHGLRHYLLVCACKPSE